MHLEPHFEAFVRDAKPVQREVYWKLRRIWIKGTWEGFETGEVVLSDVQSDVEHVFAEHVVDGQVNKAVEGRKPRKRTYVRGTGHRHRTRRAA